MSNYTSQQIGDIFEKASIKMLIILFKEWGYDINLIETRRQKSGSQHGFDILLKVYQEKKLPIYVFIECKGSKSFNTISKFELAIKSDQLKRNSFPVKDVHIFFSPTRRIDYQNDEPTIEEDDNPFCVIDMMSTDRKISDTCSLFLTYTGRDDDINNYIINILKPIVKDKEPKETFEDIVQRLKSRFQSRLKAFLSKPDQSGVLLLTSTHWNAIKENTDTSKLPNYYLRLDSTKTRLFQVIANEYHVSNSRANSSLLKLKNDLETAGGGMIKILSNGGDGKSTFLLEIGKKLCSDHPVFLINEWKDSTMGTIERQLSLLETKRMPIILLDDASKSENFLDETAEILANWRGGIILIIAERYYRYQKMQKRDYIESLFMNEPRLLNLRSRERATEIFEKFYNDLKTRFPQLVEHDYQKSNILFNSNRKHTIAERIFSVLKMLHESKRIAFVFDWDEWKQVHQNSPLQHLYLLVSAFYQFGNSVTIDFCSNFSDYSNINKIEIRNAVDNNPNQPIIRNGEYLLLRHEKVAEWYIEEEQQQDNVRALYKEWLKNIETTFQKNLLLWTYRNRDFKRCVYLKDIIDFNLMESLLNTYILNNPSELASRTELSKIYQQQKKWTLAEEILKESLDLDNENLPARTELSKIYQKQKKWTLAEEILKESLAIDNEQLHPRTELSKIYQQQKKWTLAIKYLKEYIDIDPDGLHPRTELSKIYQKQKKWTLAEEILKESLAIDNEQLHPRTELSKIYQQQKKWTLAEEILKELLDLDNENLQARTELSKIHQQQKNWTLAEEILKELLDLDNENLQARTELSKIYQQQKKWTLAEEILKEILDLDNENIPARTELSKIYQKQKKWTLAEEILKESLAIDNEQLHPRTELSKIYQQQKKWTLAIKYLKEYIDIDPDGLHPRTELSKIYQKQKKWTLAEEILKESLAIDNEQLHPRTELSKIYQKQKKWTLAEEILKESLAIDNEQLHPRTELSKIYQKQKKWTLAEEILKESLAIDNEQLHPRTELSKIYQKQKKWTLAEEILKESLAIDNEQLHPRTELSKISQKQKKWTLAEEILKEILDLDNENLPARTELSKIYQKQKKWTLAIKYLEEYIDIDPDGLHPRTELSKIYQQQKKWTLAIKYLEEYIDIDPDGLHPRTELSKIYQQQKKWTLAEEILKEALDIDQKNFRVLTEMALVYKKWSKADASKRGELQKQYRTAVIKSFNVKQNNVAILMELAYIFRNRRRYRAALFFLERILELKESDIESIRVQEEIHGYMSNYKLVNSCRQTGIKLVERFPHNRFNQRFLNQHIETNSQKKLVSIKNIGVYRYIYQTKEMFIENAQSNRINIFENANICKKLRNRDKVFFGQYEVAGRMIADCIEPTFESLKDLIDSV